MICPFRKSTVIGSNLTEEFYQDCYKEECPYYKKDINNNDLCNRVEYEEWRAAFPNRGDV